jgi:hypothetical protein
MVEGAQVEFVDGTDDLLLEGFVGGVVLDEERFQLVVVLAYVGNLGARESVGNCGGWAGIEGNDKRFACKCVVDFGGDGESEQTEKAVAKVGSNGCSVGIEGELEVFKSLVCGDANDGGNGWMRKTVNNFGEGGRHVGVVFLFFARSRGFCGAFAWSLMGVREALLAFERRVGWIQY